MIYSLKYKQIKQHSGRDNLCCALKTTALPQLNVRYFQICILALLLIANPVKAQKEVLKNIEIGAQVFIEPGQSTADIDNWFRLLHDNNMTICRIRMFESYMHQPDGNWDFSMFDKAFVAAEKYNIKVYGTLFPNTEKTNIGGFKFPSSDSQFADIAVYIKQVTEHFTKFKSLYGWVLENEPGLGSKIPNTEFTAAKYEEWKKLHPSKNLTTDGFPVLVDFSEQQFLVDYTTWYLNWLASEVRKYDTKSQLHVNGHQIFKLCAEYNFPEWRKFLSSMGGSAHASWHFGYFTRQQYALAMAADCEMVRSGAGNIPWFMTELQGGNNTYSGLVPMCPTPEEISQWLWLVIGTEGKGAIFWTLNPRSSGIEAGEWGLLNYQDAPSARFTAAAGIAGIINREQALFSDMKEISSSISILYTRESLWAEKELIEGLPSELAGRKEGGIMKSVVAYFEAISNMGLNAGISAFDEFDFTKNDYHGKVIILANQISIPEADYKKLEHFVACGGKLIVDGLSFYYTEDMQCAFIPQFKLAELLGGTISEFICSENLFKLKIGNSYLPAHLWQGLIENKSSEVLGISQGKATAIRNHYKEGEVLWIPSPIGLGSFVSGDGSGITRLMADELKEQEANFPIRFASPQTSIIMKTLQSGSSYITIIVNKSDEKRDILLQTNKSLSSKILYANKAGMVKGKTVYISPEETIVVQWE